MLHRSDVYCLQYIDLKCVDPDSQQTGIAVSAASPAIMQNIPSEGVMRVVRYNNVPVCYILICCFELF
jgi:hypothetical protein